MKEKISCWLRWTEGAVADPPEQTMTRQQQLDQSWEELRAARDLLQNTAEPDMIDYAIYRMLAAECRCGYLLRQTKQALAASKGDG
jgi:hypothetical protein